jgi:hypothetical protein
MIVEARCKQKNSSHYDGLENPRIMKGLVLRRSAARLVGRCSHTCARIASHAPYTHIASHLMPSVTRILSHTSACVRTRQTWRPPTPTPTPRRDRGGKEGEGEERMRRVAWGRSQSPVTGCYSLATGVITTCATPDLFFHPNATLATYVWRRWNIWNMRLKHMQKHLKAHEKPL